MLPWKKVKEKERRTYQISWVKRMNQEISSNIEQKRRKA